MRVSRLPAISLKSLAMEARIFCLLLVGLASLLMKSSRASPIAETEAPATVADEEKLLLDCQHPDYRTYIKCLKRQKRHHYPHGDSHMEMDPHCLETCLKKCEPTDYDCDKRCTHCMKRTKHKHQIITEYETDCTSGNCGGNEHSLPATNITTNIDINNIIGHASENATDCRKYPTPPWCQPGFLPSSPPAYPPFPGPLGSSSLSGQQLTLVPQLTLGLGLGLSGGAVGGAVGGGCGYWPCRQQGTPTGIDCSRCWNPFLRYRCDVACYAVNGWQTPNFDQTKQPDSGTNCKTPYCVGGSS